VSFTNPWTKQVWSPRNYKNEYHGDVTLRRALELSLNTATVRVLEKVGVENVIELAKRMHITAPFEPNLSLALGSTEVMPLELALAYATIARGGYYLPPVAVLNISTIENEELFAEQGAESEVIVSPELAAMMIDMMEGVVKQGTAAKAARMPYHLAGKTGTTNDFRDAWFIGFSPHLLCAVWVGYDKETHLASKESGATAALPIWIDFMSKALAFYPNEDFSSPEKESISRFTPPFTPGVNGRSRSPVCGFHIPGAAVLHDSKLSGAGTSCEEDNGGNGDDTRKSEECDPEKIVMRLPGYQPDNDQPREHETHDKRHGEQLYQHQEGDDRHHDCEDCCHDECYVDKNRHRSALLLFIDRLLKLIRLQ
jgi:membrane carboxypeptidase/penicillin-binding protein